MDTPYSCLHMDFVPRGANRGKGFRYRAFALSSALSELGMCFIKGRSGGC